MDQDILEKAIRLRHEIHLHPELSGCETETKRRLTAFLRENTALAVVDRGLWFYAKYSAKRPARKAIAFRADFDAIREDEGAAHRCGHDGHASALAAFAAEVDRKGLDRDVYFIFQHGEETGIGGKPASMLLKEEPVAEIYAIHNFPGAPLGSVNTRAGTLCFASTGVSMVFSGVAAHASTPELGKNPARAISEIVGALDGLAARNGRRGKAFATVVQIAVGEEAFGISAGEGKLLLTVRGEIQEEYDALMRDIRQLAQEKADAYGLKLKTEYHDPFPETCNHESCVEKIRAVCREKGFSYVEMKEPLRTSEDFGYFTQNAPGAMVWLGSGEQTAPLHSKDFDYPDPLIEYSVALFWALAQAIDES